MFIFCFFVIYIQSSNGQFFLLDNFISTRQTSVICNDMPITVVIVYFFEMSSDNVWLCYRCLLKPVMKEDLSKLKAQLGLCWKHEIHQLFEFFGEKALRLLLFV